jgi:hypothetical protein
MPFIDVRNLPQVTAIQSALDAILNRANVTVGNWQVALAGKVAEFYATPNRLDALDTRIAFVTERAIAHGTRDVLAKLNAAQSAVGETRAQYGTAKPVVAAGMAQLDASMAGGGVNVSSGMLRALAAAGVRMAGVFGAIQAQQVGIAAIERGVLTPAEAAELYRRLQQPNVRRNTVVLVGGALLVAWVLLHRLRR